MEGKRRAGGADAAAGRREPDRARAATQRVIERHASQIMRTARRYAATPEDAEDAYQRGVEIMLTKAPDVPDAELLPWIKTVVRHEAFALRRKSVFAVAGPRANGDSGAAGEEELVSPRPTPEEQTEQLERLRVGAEALRGLKPQEARALALLAQGYTYKQICDQTGWTYTKVNRCLAEGRQTFVQRVARIENGTECERLSPKLSALVDGEAAPADVAMLRNHLRGCLACRATLREHRLTPAVVGALVPLPALGRLSWPLDRLAELGTALRLKVESLLRVGGLDLGNSFALSGGTRGIASTGLAKALALLCVGGAGVGGVTAVEQALDRGGDASAKSAGRSDQSGSASGGPRSPDARLIAERFRARDSRPRDRRASVQRVGHREVDRLGGGQDVTRPRAAALAETAPAGRDTAPARRTRANPQSSPAPGAPEPATSAPPRDDGPSSCTSPRHPDDRYDDPAHPADLYGDGVTTARHPQDRYDDPAAGRHPEDKYDGVSDGRHPADKYDAPPEGHHPDDLYGDGTGCTSES